ncbi:MAG: hypothetical protein M3004_04635 [Bacteroidota bacterium]|nr:hypothetical protein [Bacteroidota bacterium]
MKQDTIDLKEIDFEQLYYQALFIAFKKFINEEKQRNAFTELRLMEAIKAARVLYRK